MQGEPPTKASTPTGAVFLSYASQDADAARRICDALRASGIEVWFDQSELRGGDAWDRKIRDQIHDCRLFIPVISANTERRDEGYFRREWTLAADRTRDMAHNRTFLVPVVIDGTSERGASVPEKFHELQWTRLPAGETSPAFVERVRRLLGPEGFAATAVAAGSASQSTASLSARRSSVPKAAIWGAAVIAAVACAYLLADKFWLSKHAVPPVPLTAQQTVPVSDAAFNPPPHSIAVLPFVNMSGDKEQEYFSEGLTEELLDSLSRINELQVAARTSSFSFQGEHPDIAAVAHKLNVSSVLEGSVRRSGHTIRITAQLINAVTGFHMWSRTYDRDLGDVLKLQTEIATAVAEALKVTLLQDFAAKIELGGTRNPAAFDAYLRASREYWAANDEQEELSSIAAYSDAIRLDHDYALAFASRSLALTDFAWHYGSGTSVSDRLREAEADASRVTAMTPDLAEGHYALAKAKERFLDFEGAGREYERAVALAPGNARVLMGYAVYASLMRHAETGLAAIRRVIVLDPVNSAPRVWLCHQLFLARNYVEAIAACHDALAISPRDVDAPGLRGFASYSLGDFQGARSSCEQRADSANAQVCLAITYNRLGQRADADSMVLKLRASRGDAVAYHLSRIYAQWANTAEALKWLSTAMRIHDPWLEWLRTDPLLDPLRREPRFQAIERELKFPE